MPDLSLPELRSLFPALLAALPAATLAALAGFILHLLIGRGLKLLADKTRVRDEDVAPIRKIASWVVFAATSIVVLGLFGFNLGGLWGIFSTLLAMVAIGFVAVWSVLSNTLCTVLILIFRPFAIGDDIEFAGEPVAGRVEDLNFLFTTLRCTDGSVQQVPNNLFFQKVLKRRLATAPGSLAHQLRKADAT